MIQLIQDLEKLHDIRIIWKSAGMEKHSWHGNGFDYPHIYNRMKNLGMNTDELSNYGAVKYKQSEFPEHLLWRY